MTAQDDYRAVLANYPAACQPSRVDFLAGAGGFSGAALWRLATPRGPLCLRRWPREHPQPERLQFIQAVLGHVAQEGFQLVPVPLETTNQRGYVHFGGHLWELAPWMPGQADFHASPSEARLRAAMTALATFHQAAATFPLPEAGPAVSPGIQHRHERLAELASSGIDRLRVAVHTGDLPELAVRAERLLALFGRAAPSVAAVVAKASQVSVPLLPCLRDIWHDHVLFAGDRVSGLIDFGALRVECVAGDIARLLGSLVGDDADRWKIGVDSYASVRPLAAGEAALVGAFDQANVLLSGLNWIGWYYLEGRRFENQSAVLDRVDQNLKRLNHLVLQCLA